MYKVFGIALAVLAIALAVVPTQTDCQSQGKAITLANGKTVPMKCHWSGVAEIGVAAPLVVVGAMMVFSKKKNTLGALSVMGVVLGGMAVSFPAGLIGVCATPTMTCVTAMKPALMSIGGIAAAIGVVGLVISFRKKDDLSESV